MGHFDAFTSGCRCGDFPPWVVFFLPFDELLQLFWAHIGRPHLARGFVLLRLFGHHSHTHAALIGGAGVDTDLPFNRAYGSEKLLPEGLALHDIEERVDAAVCITHAYGYVVGVGKSQAGILHP